MPRTLRSLQGGVGCGSSLLGAGGVVLFVVGVGEVEDVDVLPSELGWLLGVDQDLVEWLEVGAMIPVGDAALLSVVDDPEDAAVSSFSEDDSESLEVIGLIEEARRSDAGCDDCWVDVSAGLAIRIIATVRRNPSRTAAAPR